jgi:hypothetical protein
MTSMEVQTVADRVAENQDAFRRANERIEGVADSIGGGLERLPFLCECPTRECVEVAMLTRHEYESVRARGNTFFVAPGHEVCEVEGVTIARLAQRFDRYSLMEKVGDAGKRAAELDPRAAQDG